MLPDNIKFLTVKRLRELLTDVRLRERDLVFCNIITRNLTVVRDEEAIGMIDFLPNGDVEWYEETGLEK